MELIRISNSKPSWKEKKPSFLCFSKCFWAGTFQSWHLGGRSPSPYQKNPSTQQPRLEKKRTSSSAEGHFQRCVGGWTWRSTCGCLCMTVGSLQALLEERQKLWRCETHGLPTPSSELVQTLRARRAAPGLALCRRKVASGCSEPLQIQHNLTGQKSRGRLCN